MADKEWLVGISKIDDEKRLVFGWALVSHDWVQDEITKAYSLEQVEDYQGDIIDVEDLEDMAYKFAKLYREGGEMHQRGGTAIMVESVVFTLEKQAALGIPEGSMPVGWWIGFEVLDEAAWEMVKDGTYTDFSIEGTGYREEVK